MGYAQEARSPVNRSKLQKGANGENGVGALTKCLTRLYNGLADPEEAEQNQGRIGAQYGAAGQAKAQFAFPRPSWSS